MKIIETTGTVLFFILSPIWFPLAFSLSFIKEELADRKLKGYLAYLDKGELFMNPGKELRLCNSCLEYVNNYLTISEGRGPTYIMGSEFFLYKRKSELEAAVKL